MVPGSEILILYSSARSFEIVFFVEKMNFSLPSRFMSLTLHIKISLSVLPCTTFGKPDPKAHIPRLINRVHSHPSGNSNGFSSSLISGSGFCFLILPCFTSSAFSAAIRFSSSDAGSSFGSCGTSLPRTASSRISSRNFLIPYKSILPELPRPAVERVCNAEVQVSI